ncbi:MAG: aspartate--tRNA ligase [Acidimicrobiaceae bacterium]|nr:aspartate--tRNA ligase [Acidimicrobiaceae bacterium]MBT5581776.1 aspartate--tRNA ligase [Acidimicrobiaceae bacterium]MBT5849208.1 aspartate--tRNA ligase [Acidimicrobiaceae bacterium]
MRTDMCGQLTAADAGRTVSVCGWVATRREHGENLAFIDLRDRTGIVQCVVNRSHDLRSEYVTKMTGEVRLRPADTANMGLPTGEIEIEISDIEILAMAEPPPFPLDERTDVDETIRLRHRYVDLRKNRMQTNLRTRSIVNSAIRRGMEDQGFVEIETPMLIASTPEGARDFVVPSRKDPGAFYALPQSPQLFKQLCMVGGIDRYYQIARCLRDEDLRADRQFEFMQLDAEMSFVDQEDVFAVISHTVASTTEAVTGERPTEFPRITWLEAQERFGSDKPDTRFGMELVELTAIFEGTEARVFQAPCIKGICMEGGMEALSRNQIDALVETCQRWGAKGLAWMKVIDGESGPTLDAGVAKFLSNDESSQVVAALKAQPGDMVFLVADERRLVRHVLGLLRLELGRPPVNEGGLNFVWVVDFPLFESINENGKPVPSHHPFTMPHEDDWALLDEGGDALLDVRSQAYDLVLNGWELGSGSIRINRPDIQNRIFELLGIGEEERNAKFGFLLDAFRFGAPPHGGFAFGIDRITALLVGETNIREVIAFPKTQSGSDPLTNAPSAIDAAHLAELGLGVLPPRT